MPYHIRLIMLLTYATYNNTVQYNIISPVELKFTIVTLLKKLNNYVIKRSSLFAATNVHLFLVYKLPLLTICFGFQRK